MNKDNIACSYSVLCFYSSEIWATTYVALSKGLMEEVLSEYRKSCSCDMVIMKVIFFTSHIFSWSSSLKKEATITCAVLFLDFLQEWEDNNADECSDNFGVFELTVITHPQNKPSILLRGWTSRVLFLLWSGYLLNYLALEIVILGNIPFHPIVWRPAGFLCANFSLRNFTRLSNDHQIRIITRCKYSFLRENILQDSGLWPHEAF